MLKRVINYKDFNGKDVSEIFYFNLTRVELVDMEVSETEGLADMLRRIIETSDTQALVAEFKKLIQSAYGQKSEDGKRFIKTPELTREFVQSAAYDELFMELATDEKAASEFVTGIIPSDFVKEMQKEVKDVTVALPPPPPQPQL